MQAMPDGENVCSLSNCAMGGYFRSLAVPCRRNSSPVTMRSALSPWGVNVVRIEARFIVVLAGWTMSSGGRRVDCHACEDARTTISIGVFDVVWIHAFTCTLQCYDSLANEPHVPLQAARWIRFPAPD